MPLLLNLIWLVFGGPIVALGYALVAVVIFLLIITIPLGIASGRTALFCVWPFGRTIVSRWRFPTAAEAPQHADDVLTPGAGVRRRTELRGWDSNPQPSP